MRWNVLKAASSLIRPVRAPCWGLSRGTPKRRLGKHMNFFRRRSANKCEKMHTQNEESGQTAAEDKKRPGKSAKVRRLFIKHAVFIALFALCLLALNISGIHCPVRYITAFRARAAGLRVHFWRCAGWISGVCFIIIRLRRLLPRCCFLLCITG